MKILSLGLIGMLFVVTTIAIGSADNNNSIINQLSQTTEATTTTTDISFGAKALQFLTYCNNQFSQIPVSSMTTDTLVFCTMVYDWYLNGCNNTIIAPIIAAQCRDPVIIQQVNNYKTQIDIRIQQIIKIEIPPSRDGGEGNGKLHYLTISITIAKDPITHGSVQTITVIVSDSESNKKIEGAKVNGKVQYVTGHTETFTCITDADGKCSHSWRISGNATPGIFIVIVEVSASGYKSASKTTSFEVIPKYNTTLPIDNGTIVNDTSREIFNDTDTGDNATGSGNGEQGGDSGNDNGNNATILPILPDPCIENPNLPECIQTSELALPGEDKSPLLPPQLDTDTDDGGDADTGDSGDTGNEGSKDDNAAGGGDGGDSSDNSGGSEVSRSDNSGDDGSGGDAANAAE